MEKPNEIYGRLKESIHIAGYTFERAYGELKHLLQNNRWKEVGIGFNDIHKFVKSISFAEFKIAIEQRKELANILSEIGASQRETAKLTGVSKDTIRRDIGANAPPEKNINIEYENVIDNIGANAPPNLKWIEEPGNKKVKQEIKKEEKQKEKDKKRKEQAEKGSKIADNEDFRFGEFEKVLNNIPDNSIDLILTDPPYSINDIECWNKLSEFAYKKLKPNKFCITYSGQLNLSEVIKRMEENLFYYWTFALLQTGSNQLINARNIFCGWKPILIFQKGFKILDFEIDDLITGSGREKDQHDWQQGEFELKQIIEKFTNPGDLIVEPFAGGGTTIIASLKLNRNIIAAEKDEETYNIAKNRIDEFRRKK